MPQDIQKVRRKRHRRFSRKLRVFLTSLALLSVLMSAVLLIFGLFILHNRRLTIASVIYLLAAVAILCTVQAVKEINELEPTQDVNDE